MQKINKIENGSAVALTLADENGVFTTYKLALAIDKAYRFCGETLKYVFVAENGFGFDGAYSGGATGCGVNPRSIVSLSAEDRYEIVATDLAEINAKVDEHNAACDAERARELELKAKRDAAVKAAVELDKEFTIYDNDVMQLDVHAYVGRSGSRLVYSYTLRDRWANGNPRTSLVSRSKLINKAGKLSSQAVKTYGASGREMAKAALAWEETQDQLFKLAKASV